jgi:hypothetical protein
MDQFHRDFLFRTKPQTILLNSSVDSGQSLQERLKIAFETFKGWTQNANHDLMTAKNISDTLFASIQTVIAKSKNRMDIIENFFSKVHVVFKAEASFKSQLQKFMFQKTTKVNSKRIVSENNQISDLIENFEEEFEEVIAKFNQLEKKLKSTIASKTFKQRLHPIQDKVCRQIVSIQNFKKALENKMNNLNSNIDVFESKITEKNRSQAKTEHSFYDLFREIFTLFDALLLQLKEYNASVLQLYEEVFVLETMTVKSIKETFLVFMDAITDIFGSKTSHYFSLSRYLASNLNENEVGGFAMDLATLLQPVGIEIILKKCKVEALTVDVLKVFFQGIELEAHSHILQILVQNQFDGLIYHNQEAGIKCKVIATFDQFYLIFEQGPLREGWQLTHSLPFKNMDISKTSTTGYLNIKAKVKRLLWKSERQLFILFPFQISENFLIFHNEVTGRKYEPVLGETPERLNEISNRPLDFGLNGDGIKMEIKDTIDSERVEQTIIENDEWEGRSPARNYQTFFDDSDN